ncbi:MAG: class I SAM-dependent methyltransferase [Rhizobiales bacterium]|nr:class I SAM-dependent methyltransferase [Hyphomicrobiales bacterium]MBI3673933.1 class I SAM-dependent methyltransferase [Hyphomicrobiales bacterium]
MARSGPLQTHYDNYRLSHTADGYGEYYDKTYETGYFLAVWRDVERPVLEGILGPLGGPDRVCMDFACGTGRITDLDARFFGSVLGVDVSESMLARAQRPENVRFRRIDLTRETMEETFDVVTAFRFFLNAEESLRREALRAIYARLKPDGRLVCNIHMNAISPGGIGCHLINLIPGMRRRHTLSAAGFRRRLEAAGFAVEQVISYGFMPGPRILPAKVSSALVKPVEKLAGVLRLPGILAQNFMVVARKR